ncbi:hypothetical protein ACHAXA_008906 [Cyclostephanos tholiformis]|uniref:Uncharacterized protein n=1 Tax=Cyclostephanos tholiformis TaxID=382380 RepID=A0ABD3R430_9STRA
MLKIRLLLVAVLPACIRASTFRPRNGLGYLPPGARTVSKHNSVLDVAVAASTPKLDESKCEFTLRGGDGDIVNADIPKANELVGAAFFTALQIVLNKVFRANKITFPAMLGCTILVFSSLVLAEIFFPGMGESAFQLLTPGSSLLAKWLPVMFVPGLAMLPLAPSIGSAVDVLKVLSLIILGFGFTMGSTAYLVLGMRTLQGQIETNPTVNNDGRAVTTAASSPPPKPFTEETLKFLLKGTVLTGAVSMAASRQNSGYATPIRTVFMFFGTVLMYVFGARFPPAITKIVHPLVTATAGTLLLTKLDATITGSSFKDILKTYKAGSLSPTKTGAGDLLLFLLGPAVGCLSIAMYSRKKILADNLPVVIAAMLCSSVGGLFGTAWYIRLLGVGASVMVRLSLLTRNVTTGLAIIITQMLEGDMAIAASVVVLTGIFAATVGRGLLDFFNIQDPVSRGLGMGAAGQGLGVAAIMPEKDAFPFAAINMVLTAICASALVSIPAVKKSLTDIVSAGL